MALPWITAEQIWYAQTYGHRFDIGQFRYDPTAKRALEACVKAGSMVTVRAMWPYFHYGTCTKTCYVNTEPATAEGATVCPDQSPYPILI